MKYSLSFMSCDSTVVRGGLANMFTAFIFIFVLSLDLGESRNASCRFSIHKDLSVNAPILLMKEGSDYVFPNPSDNGTVIIRNGGEMIFSCPNIGFTSSGPKRKSVVGKCTSSNQFEISGKMYYIRNLTCASRTNPLIRQLAKYCAGNQGKLITVGFNVTLANTSFVKTVIEICFNANLSRTFYTQHTLMGKGVNSIQVGRRPAFRTVSFLYRSSPDEVYRIEQQKLTVLKELGISDSQTFFARGHLTPDADFVYLTLQDATYYYINVAPQWQSFNAVPWFSLENSIRNLAGKTKADYDIITGTHNTLTNADENNKIRELHLYGNKTNSPKIPIPAFFWKIVKERKSDRGIAFVGFNHFENQQRIPWPCSDICPEYDWGSESWVNFIICCTVQEFTTNFNVSPNIRVSGILRGQMTRKPNLRSRGN